jgi:hypothetical protein
VSFALNFIPIAPITPTDLVVNYNSFLNVAEVHFPKQFGLNEYHLHYTNWENVESIVQLPTDVDSVYQAMPFSKYHHQLKIDASNPIVDCPQQPQQGVAYVCNGEIFAYVSDPSINSAEKTIFSLTSIVSGKESDIGIFYSIG